MKPHIVTVSGPSLSGKTEFTKILHNKYSFNSVVSVTTRPKRSHEVDGIDYHFVDLNCYSKLSLIQKTAFNNYDYGVTEEEINNKKDLPILWVVAPESVQQIEDYCDKNNFLLTKIFITNPQEVLFSRLFERFKKDSDANITTYVNRLLSIINTENQWVIQANDNNSNLKYDFVFNTFNEKNTETIVENIANYILEQSKKNNTKKIKP